MRTVFLLLFLMTLAGEDLKFSKVAGDALFVGGSENKIVPNQEYDLKVPKNGKLIYSYEDGKKPEGELIIKRGEKIIVKDSERPYYAATVESGDYKVKFVGKGTDKVVLTLAIEETDKRDP